MKTNLSVQLDTMAIKEVLTAGHPELRAPTQVVEDFNSLELQSMIQDSFDTMKALDGAGLAAIQINYPYRFFTFGFKYNPRYPNEGPIEDGCLINPVITQYSKETEEAFEGCISVPNVRAKVSRSIWVDYTGYDSKGNLIEERAEGFYAKIIQHETDHLNGILFIERVTDLKSVMMTDQWLRWHLKK